MLRGMEMEVGRKKERKKEPTKCICRAVPPDFCFGRRTDRPPSLWVMYGENPYRSNLAILPRVDAKERPSSLTRARGMYMCSRSEGETTIHLKSSCFPCG